MVREVAAASTDGIIPAQMLIVETIKAGEFEFPISLDTPPPLSTSFSPFEALLKAQGDLWWCDGGASRHEAHEEPTTVQRGYVAAAAAVVEALCSGSSVTIYCSATNIVDSLDNSAAWVEQKLRTGQKFKNADWWGRVLRQIKDKQLIVMAKHRAPKDEHFAVTRKIIAAKVDEARRNLGAE